MFVLIMLKKKEASFFAVVFGKMIRVQKLDRIFRPGIVQNRFQTHIGKIIYHKTDQICNPQFCGKISLDHYDNHHKNKDKFSEIPDGIKEHH